MKLIALLLAWRVAAAATSPENVKDRYLVKLCETSWLDREPAETAATLAESVGAKVKHVYKHMLSGFSVTGSAQAAEALKNKPEICGVQPVLWRRKHEAPVEQAGTGQEPIEAIDFWGKNRVLDLPLDDRGNHTGGKGVSIVLIDSGLDTQHVEFSNTDERVVANIADCVDNWRYYEPWGWDTLAAANKTVADTLNTDFDGHGTHTSGSAGGKNVGIAPGADMFMITATHGDGYADDDELCAMETIAEALDQGHLTEKTVISASLGGQCQIGLSPGDPKVTDGRVQDPSICRDASQSILHNTDDYFEPFRAKGVAITVSAGNAGDDACFYTPAASSSAVTVGSSDRTDTMSSFSNFGACVDTVAPGSEIWSALTSHLTTPEGVQDLYRSMDGTSMATPLVAGTTALYLEALGAGASALEAQYAMLHANKPSVIAPSAAQNASAIKPSCPTNAALAQAPSTVEGGFDTSIADPGAGCQLAEPRLYGFKCPVPLVRGACVPPTVNGTGHKNGSSPADQCDVGPTQPADATYSFMLFNTDPRAKICLWYQYPPDNATVISNTGTMLTAGMSLEIKMPTGSFAYQYYYLPNDSNATCAEAAPIYGLYVAQIEPNTPGPFIGWTQSQGPFFRAAETGGKSAFVQDAAGVGNCAFFLRYDGAWNGMSGMSKTVNGANYFPYGRQEETSAPITGDPSCLGRPQGLSDTVQMVLSCTNGVNSWTTTKNFCPDWFCRNATMLWAATYSEADGLQLSVTQSRTCGKEESCAAGGHDDNDDNDDSHSDGAAATTGPLAALFITIITIVITL